LSRLDCCCGGSAGVGLAWGSIDGDDNCSACPQGESRERERLCGAAENVGKETQLAS